MSSRSPCPWPAVELDLSTASCTSVGHLTTGTEESVAGPAWLPMDSSSR
jgi:hypothetical protein